MLEPLRSKITGVDDTGYTNIDSSGNLMVNVAAMDTSISGEDQLNSLLATRQKAGVYTVSMPAAGTAANASVALSATYKHVCTGFTVSVYRKGSPTTAEFVTAQLVDGTTVMWQGIIPIGADATGGVIVVNDCWFEGSVGKLMALNTAANANVTMCASMTTVDIL